MSASNNNVFNQNTGDIISERTQSKETKMMQGFREIGYTSIEDTQQQPQITPRQVRTGQTRGDRQIRGLDKVEDRNGRVVMMMGQTEHGVF